MRYNSALGANVPNDRSRRRSRIRSPIGLPPGSRLSSAPIAGGEQRGLRGFPDALAAFDRDQPARSTHGSKVRASRSAARLLVATRSPSAAQARDAAIPLSLSTTSVMASSCEARCFWISIASCKTASASL